MADNQDTLLLEQFFRHPAIRGKVHTNLNHAALCDQVLYLFERAWERKGGDFVLRLGYGALHRLEPRYFPSFSSLKYISATDSTKIRGYKP
ncbi:hypothetical protein HYX14_00075 [Candidatus Woesearchaeota archaeon]|nr:hypothetical protein [Candidatus Woesearchaeota archaeon]